VDTRASLDAVMRKIPSFLLLGIEPPLFFHSRNSKYHKHGTKLKFIGILTEIGKWICTDVRIYQIRNRNLTDVCKRVDLDCVSHNGKNTD